MNTKWFRVGIIGTVVAVLCCATPLAVVVLGTLGLGALTGWIDIVAIPAILIFGAIAVISYKKRGSE
jgi:mercuric ion transport protein